MKNSNLNFIELLSSQKIFETILFAVVNGGKLPTKYNGVSTVTSFNNSSTIQHVYAMFNHIYKFSSKNISKFNNQTSSWKKKIQKKIFQSPVQINWVSKNFQSSNQVNLEWKNFKNISKFINWSEKISKFKVQNAWWWNSENVENIQSPDRK